MAGLREVCFAILEEAAPRFVELQWADGRFSTEAEHATEEWNFFDQQFVLAAALLYTSERPGNAWRESPRLRDAILRNGRHLVSHVGADGTMAWRLNGVVLGHPFVCQRLTCAWLQAYQLLGERLPEGERRQWREAILRACGWLWEHKVLPFHGVTRFTSHEVQTGTNHFALYLSLLWRAGTEFGRPEWVAASAEIMRKLIADQRPGGYWEEHHGPALGYNYLTYHGVDEYTAWSGDAAGIAALRRGLDLHQHWTYPDGTPIECIDGRMRHLHQPLGWGTAGFTHWPEGRGYARLLLERLRELAPLSGETVARVASACLLLTEGAEAPPPQAWERYRATLEDCSVVRKEGPWVTTLSGQCSPTWEDNQFVLDRQAALSVWHAGAGLVIDGSNSKHQPELATFHRPGEEPDCLPRRAEILPSGPDEEAVGLHYGGFAATVSAKVLDREAAEIRLAVAGEGSGNVVATLVPNVSYGETITIGGVGEVTLGEAALDLAPGRHGGWIGYRGVVLRLPEGAQVRYPVSPFSSYSADNRSTPSANRLVVTCRPGEGPAVFRVEERP